MASQPVGSQQVSHYQLVQQMGVSGLGAIFVATDTRTDKPVTLRVLQQEYLADRRYRERFVDEAQFAASLRHPYLCPVLETGTLVDGTPFIALDPVEGSPLANQLAPNKPWPPRAAVEFVIQVAEAVSVLHKHGRLHCDLNPTTILVSVAGEPVLDHGLSRRITDTDTVPNLLASGSGHQAYLSPEQIEGPTQAMGPATDVYSLGVVLYQILTGRLPFEDRGARVFKKILAGNAPPPVTVRADIDPQLNVLCMQAIARQPAQRFASMDALVHALREWLARKPRPGKGHPPGLMPVDERLLDSAPATFVDMNAVHFDSDANLGRPPSEALPPLATSLSTVQQPRPAGKAPPPANAASATPASPIPPPALPPAAPPPVRESQRGTALTMSEMPELPPVDPRATMGPARGGPPTLRPRAAEPTQRGALPLSLSGLPGSEARPALPPPAAILQPVKDKPILPPVSGTAATLTHNQQPISLPDFDDSLPTDDQPPKTLPPQPQQRLKPLSVDPIFVEPEGVVDPVMISGPTEQDLLPPTAGKPLVPVTLPPPPQPPAQARGSSNQMPALGQPAVPVLLPQPSLHGEVTVGTVLENGAILVEPEMQAIPEEIPQEIPAEMPGVRARSMEAMVVPEPSPLAADPMPPLATLQPGTNMPSVPLFPGAALPAADAYPPPYFPPGYPANGMPGLPGSTTVPLPERMVWSNVAMIGLAGTLLLTLLLVIIFIVVSPIIQPKPTALATESAATQGSGGSPTARVPDPTPNIKLVLPEKIPEVVNGYGGLLAVKLKREDSYAEAMTLSVSESKADTEQALLEPMAPIPITANELDAKWTVRFTRAALRDKCMLRLKLSGKVKGEERTFDEKMLEVRILSPELKIGTVGAIRDAEGRLPHGGPIPGVAFSPDGRWLALGGVDRKIQIWDTRGNRLIQEINDLKSEIRALFFRGDGQQLVAVTADQTMFVYDQTPRNRQEAEGIFKLSFNPVWTPHPLVALDLHAGVFDAQTQTQKYYLGAATPYKNPLLPLSWSLDLWDISDLVRISKTHWFGWPAVTSMQWNLKGTLLAAAQADGSVNVWKVDKVFNSFELLYSLAPKLPQPVQRLAFSPDDKLLALGGSDGKVRLWSLKDMETIVLGDQRSEVMFVQFGDNGKLLATGSVNGKAMVWDVATRKANYTVDALTEETASGWGFNPEGTTLCRTTSSGRGALYDSRGEATALQPLERRGPVEGIALNADATLLATAGYDKLIKLWSLNADPKIPPRWVKTLRGHTDAVGPLAFSPDGKWLASGSKDQTVRVWDVTTGVSLAEIRLPGIGYAVAFSPDSKSLVIGTGEWAEIRYIAGQILLWNVESRTLEKPFDGHGAAVLALGFDPTGRHLVSGSIDGSVNVWEVSTRKLAIPLVLPLATGGARGNQGSVRSVAFSADGTWLVTAGVDATSTARPKAGEVHVWRVEKGAAGKLTFRYERSLSGHEKGMARAANFTPSGRTLVTAANGSVLRAWNVATLLLLDEFAIAPDNVYCLAFSTRNWPAAPSGVASASYLLVTGQESGEVRLWTVTELGPP